MRNVSVLLNISELKKTKIFIDCEKIAFYFKYISQNHELCISDEFIKYLNYKINAFALVINNTYITYRITIKRYKKLIIINAAAIDSKSLTSEYAERSTNIERLACLTDFNNIFNQD